MPMKMASFTEWIASYNQWNLPAFPPTWSFFMRWFVLFILALFVAAPLKADDKADLVAKQKKAAMENVTKMGIDNTAFAETDNLILCGPFPQDKLKSWGDVVQKNYSFALKGLKVEPADLPTKGKIAVYFVPDRKIYTAFVGELLNDRVDKDEQSHFDVKSDTPWLAVTVLPGGKPTDFDVVAAGQIGVALLQRKVGNAVLPSWMKEGFSKAIQLRSGGNAAMNERAAIKRWLASTKDKPSKYKVSDIWMTAEAADKRLLAASLMEYFVYGSGAATFTKITKALNPDENGQKPTIEAALASAEIKVDDLDKAWKKWVLTGK